MAIKPIYWSNGDLRGYEETYDGDPLAQANQTRDYIAQSQNAQRAAAFEGQQRDADRRLQLELVARQQQGAQQRELLDAYTRSAMQGQALGAQAQSQQAQLAQREAESQRGAKQDMLNWALRGYEGEEERAQRSEQFERTGQQGAYEFEQRQGQQAEMFAYEQQQRAAEAEAGRRQQFEMAEYQAQLEKEKQQTHYALQAQLHQQELSNTEQMRLGRLKQSLAGVQEQLDKGEITPAIAQAAMMRLKTGIDPLEMRKQQSEQTQMKLKEQMMVHEAEVQTLVRQKQGAFLAKNFQERTHRDGSGNMWFEKRPDEWELVPDRNAEMEAKRQDAYLKQQEKTQEMQDKAQERQDNRIRDAEKHAQERWQSAYQSADRWVDQQIRMATKMDEFGKKVPDQEKQADFEARRDEIIRQRLKAQRFADNPFDEIEKVRQRYGREPSGPPVEIPTPTPTPTVPSTPGRIVVDRQATDTTTGERTAYPPTGMQAPAPEPTPAPEAAPQRPQQFARVFQQLDTATEQDRSMGGMTMSKNERTAIARVKATLSNPAGFESLAPEQKTQFLNDLREALPKVPELFELYKRVQAAMGAQ